MVATGSAAKRVAFANGFIRGVAADARGVNKLIPTARTVIDVGAEESRVIKVSPDGRVLDFVINDKCAEVCPTEILEIGPNEIEIFREEPVAFVKHEERKKVRYSCAPCKPGYGEKPSPCTAVCEPRAISHSDGWEKLYWH